MKERVAVRKLVGRSRETKMAAADLSISCSFSSSSRCRSSTDSMIWRSSAVRWLRSGIGGRDGRRLIDDDAMAGGRAGGRSVGPRRTADGERPRRVQTNGARVTAATAVGGAAPANI